MRKILLILSMILSSSIYSQIGIKGGLTYNGENGLYKSISNTYSNKGKEEIGYHIGLYKKIKFSELYLQPELLYVSYQNEFKNETGNNFDLKQKRIDIPVSIGSSIFKFINIQAGPVLSYYFKDELSLENTNSINQKDFSLGLQVGTGISLSNLDITIRYDFPLEKHETNWVQNQNLKFTTEDTPRLLHISLGYRF